MADLRETIRQLLEKNAQARNIANLDDTRYVELKRKQGLGTITKDELQELIEINETLRSRSGNSW